MRVGLTWSRDQGLNILEDFPSLLNYRSSAAPAVPRFCLCLTSRRYQKTWLPPSKDDEWWRATRRRQPACKDSGAKNQPMSESNTLRERWVRRLCRRLTGVLTRQRRNGRKPLL